MGDFPGDLDKKRSFLSWFEVPPFHLKRFFQDSGVAIAVESISHVKHGIKLVDCPGELCLGSAFFRGNAEQLGMRCYRPLASFFFSVDDLLRVPGAREPVIVIDEQPAENVPGNDVASGAILIRLREE